MLLNNYWNWKKIVEYTDYSTSIQIISNAFIETNGSNVDMVINTSSAGVNYTKRSGINRVLCQQMYLALGTGTTQPTADDYNVSEPINFSNIAYTRNEYFNDDGVLVKRFGISGQNMTGADKLITEAILYKQIYTSNGSDTTYNVAFVHEVISTPILIRANENFMINFDWIEQ